MDRFTIGEVAKQACVRMETLRYYERRGFGSSLRHGMGQITDCIRQTPCGASSSSSTRSTSVSR